jgi:anaerobic selenocysteine-containing dehydrogenase
VRSILAGERIFIVVQDLFLTETAALADVVLPAATWGEKTGTFTNADRTVHLCERAVDPPGEARSDLDIFLDFARRMDFRDRDGAPLIEWTGPESAFEAWKACSAGRPCDYAGITYDLLRERGGIQWGGERLHGDGRFWAAPDECESYGKDLVTGASVEPVEYRSLNPHGRAILKAADHVPPDEQPDERHPVVLTTGRSLYHFHTRTRPFGRPSCRRPRPMCGWSSRQSTRASSAWRTAIRSRSCRRAEPCGRRRASPTSAPASPSCPSTTATGTPAATVTTAPPTS